MDHKLEDFIFMLVVQSSLEGFGLPVWDLDEKEKDWLYQEIVETFKKEVLKAIEEASKEKGNYYDRSN